MKKILLLLTFVFGASYSAFAGTCTTDTLADYIHDGSCSIGTDLTFSGFDLNASGSVIIPANEITVTPTTIGDESGFVFSAPWGLTNGENLDSEITYTATCDGCMIDDWVLAIAGAGSTGNGFVNVAETSPEVTQGLALSDVNRVITGTGTGTFTPVGSLTVTKDILVNGGSTANTTTQVSGVTNLFSTTTTTTMTPEPSLAILCTGLIGLVPLIRRRFVS
jgi:hypothetical protein